MFGLFSSREEEAAVESIKTDFASLLIHPSALDLARGLESWSWLSLPNSPPVLVSAFGDPFFKVRGQLVMLNTLTGTLESVARNAVELRNKLNETEVQDSLLSSVWVQAAVRRGILLEDGQCYDWRLAPALGGPMSPASIMKLSFVVKVNIAGQLHRQIKDLPPGTRINRVTISPEQ
jgi:hypothetical protein